MRAYRPARRPTPGQVEQMLHELQPAEYNRVIPLFEGVPLTYFTVVVKAIAAGNSPGRIWADSITHPGTALVWDEGPAYCLAGHSENAHLNHALAELIGQQLTPQSIARGHSTCKIYYTPETWEGGVADLFHNLSLQKRDRVLFTLEQPRISDWRDRVPAGCSIERVDAKLLRRDNLITLDRVREEVACCWTSIGRFLDKGFGFCMLCRNTIVCWCTGEYGSGRGIGIGIEIVEEYQGRGFATLTALAFVEHCVANGLTPYWDAWKSNLPSIAVAKKIGFAEVSEYSVFIGRSIGS